MTFNDECQDGFNFEKRPFCMSFSPPLLFTTQFWKSTEKKINQY